MGRQQIIIGFVTEEFGDGALCVWSPSRRDDIIIDGRFRPHKDVLGKWVELEVDEHSRVCEPVVIIRDRYNYMKNGRLAELELDIQHEGCFRNKMEMFKHHEIGLISDPTHVVRNVQQNAFYKVWVIANRTENETGARWVISTGNRNPQPTFQRSGTQSPDYNHYQRDDRRFVRSPSPDGYNYRRRQSRSSERSHMDPSYRDYNRQSPDFQSRDNYGYHPGPPSTSGSHRSHSSSRRNYCPEDGYSARNDMNGRRETNENVIFNRNQSPNNYPEDRIVNRNLVHSSRSQYPEHRPSTTAVVNISKRELQPDNRRQSPLPEHRSSEHVTKTELLDQRPKTNESIHTKNETRRDRSPSNRSRAETTSEEESEDEGRDWKKPDLKSTNLVQNNEPTIATPKTEQIVTPTDISVPSNDSSMNSTSNRVRSVIKAPQSLEEKEIHKLRSNVNQMKELIKNLTRNEDVVLAMQLANLEEYEELIGIVGRT